MEEISDSLSNLSSSLLGLLHSISELLVQVTHPEKRQKCYKSGAESAKSRGDFVIGDTRGGKQPISRANLSIERKEMENSQRVEKEGDKCLSNVCEFTEIEGE